MEPILYQEWLITQAFIILERKCLVGDTISDDKINSSRKWVTMEWSFLVFSSTKGSQCQNEMVLQAAELACQTFLQDLWIPEILHLFKKQQELPA